MVKKIIKNSGLDKSTDYKELVDFLVDKFEEVNNKLDQKADKADIDKIYQILETKADKADIGRIMDRIARLDNKIDDYRADQIGLKRQVELHEKKIAAL